MNGITPFTNSSRLDQKVSKKVISFCLFGSEPIYTIGAVKNAQIASKIYPDWSLLFWLGDNVPEYITSQLVATGADCRPSPLSNPMLSRFLVNDEPDVERYIVRDTDSRLNAREQFSVNEWIQSQKKFHVIRDHPGQCVVMPGGLWGGTPGEFSMSRLIDKWTGNKAGGHRNSIYNNDQLFLRDAVWPLIQKNCFQHDFCNRNVFRNATPFPARFGEWRFSGERIMVDETPEPYTWERRISWMSP